MSAGAYLDACGFAATSTGTGSFVVSAAALGCQTPASAGAVNLTVYSYRAESADKSQWEEGFGAYTVSTVTLARTTITANSSGGATAISFSTVPNVYITALSQDLQNATLLTGGTIPAARITFAVKSDQTTATSTTVPVNPAIQQNHPSAAKAWVNFLTAGTINDSFNVSGVVKNSTGNWTVTYTTAFTDANYASFAMIQGGGAVIIRVSSQTTTTAVIQTLSTTFVVIDPTIGVTFAAFGPQ